MERFITPPLRRAHAFFAAFPACCFTLAFLRRSLWNKERLYAELLSASWPATR
ncbi:MAG: hypothetical protein HYY24_05910 [Verrucomicrobia bacterium]|nr:hypothetical protein [Verrucomicrobiota bacterium]